MQNGLCATIAYVIRIAVSTGKPAPLEDAERSKGARGTGRASRRYLEKKQEKKPISFRGKERRKPRFGDRIDKPVSDAEVELRALL